MHGRPRSPADELHCSWFIRPPRSEGGAGDEVAATLSAPAFERLVSSLAMVIGREALIVERDIRALSLDEAEEVSAWAARALVRASLAEAKLATARSAPATAARGDR